MAIHGNKSQTARTKALAEFKDGDLQVLVATDIAARGIDIDQLPHVVNYELPNVPEDYVHRIGRTGRAGATGEAISLVCVDEHGFLRDIEKLIKREIPKEVVPGFEPTASERAEPIVLGRMVIGEGGRPRRCRGNGGATSRRAAAPGDSSHGAAAAATAAAARRARAATAAAASGRRVRKGRRARTAAPSRRMPATAARARRAAATAAGARPAAAVAVRKAAGSARR